MGIIESESKPSFLLSTRFLLAVIIFFGYCFNYMQKVDMGIAIVCMVNNTAVKEISNSNHFNASDMSYKTSNYSLYCQGSQLSAKKFDGPFVWTKRVQGFVLSAYFYGYILTQIPGGWLSFKFGGRIVLCASMFLGSLMTISLPFFARISPNALFAGLFVTGAAHGSFWPSVSSFWAYWAPSEERSRLVGMSSAGAKFGNIIGYFLGGFLCVYGFDGGWASIFYIFGIMGVVWSVLLFLIGSDSPNTQKCISKQEKEYILRETKKTIQTRQICQSKIPWLAIFTSRPCIVIFIGQFSHNWGNYLFLTSIPTFLKDVLKFDMKSNGLVSSIPYIASLVSINLASIASDHLLKTNKLSRTNVRRLFISMSTILPSFVLIALSFVDCKHVYLGVALLSIGVAFDSIMIGAGHLVNINDIAGPYSGILFGISNTIATVPGIISPYVAGLLTPHQTQEEWQIVFIICACIYFVGGLIYVIFLDAEIQPWAIIELNEEKDEMSNVNCEKDEKHIVKF